MIRENNVAKIGVISDTHIPSRVQTLPARILTVFSGADFIIHCGDAVEDIAFTELEAIAPVYAVSGNMDINPSKRPEKLAIMLNDKYVLCVAHGHGSPFALKNLLIKKFSSEKPSLILFGHTHVPEISEYNGYKFFNPGSPCCGRGSFNSVGIINVTTNGIFPEIINL